MHEKAFKLTTIAIVLIMLLSSCVSEKESTYSSPTVSHAKIFSPDGETIEGSVDYYHNYGDGVFQIGIDGKNYVTNGNVVIESWDNYE